MRRKPISPPPSRTPKGLPPGEASPPEGRSIGEGPERLPDGTYKISGIARREQAQKRHGNPAEKQKEQERIARDDARYRQGFPVAGHGGPEPANNPRIRQRQSF